MTAINDSPRVRRLCVSVALERNPHWTSQEQAAAQLGLDDALDQVGGRGQPPRAAWTRTPTGDGVLAVMPPGIDEGEVISTFVRGMNLYLCRYNRPLDEHTRLRLRVAVHAGMTQVNESGFVGPGPVFAARLRDCAQVRQVMADHPRCDFAVVISQQLYDDHVGHEYPDFDAGSFRRIRLAEPENPVADVWVHRPLPLAPRIDSTGAGHQRSDSVRGCTPANTIGVQDFTVLRGEQ